MRVGILNLKESEGKSKAKEVQTDVAMLTLDYRSGLLMRKKVIDGIIYVDGWHNGHGGMAMSVAILKLAFSDRMSLNLLVDRWVCRVLVKDDRRSI